MVFTFTVPPSTVSACVSDRLLPPFMFSVPPETVVAAFTTPAVLRVPPAPTVTGPPVRVPPAKLTVPVIVVEPAPPRVPTMVPPVRVLAPPAFTVAPLAMVPPDMAIAPLTVRVPSPVTVPPRSERLPTVSVTLTFTVPTLIVSACVSDRLLPAFRFSVPP